MPQQLSARIEIAEKISNVTSLVGSSPIWKPHPQLNRLVYPTLSPCETSMLACGSIFCVAAGSCWSAVGCETSRLNSYPSAFASFVYICTSN